MAKKPKLKVFRTAIGFHDAYVAAPSQKAALEAWGATRNLFASGGAEQVTDPKLMAAALERPGQVLKVSRGTTAEQLAALGEEAKPQKRRSAEDASKPVAIRAKIGPRPNRDMFDAAEAELADVEARHAEEQADLRRDQAALNEKKAAMEKSQAGAVARLARKIASKRAAYDRALAKWKSAQN